MSDFYNLKANINKAESTKRLDKALTNILGKFSRSHIKILIENGNVKKKLAEKFQKNRTGKEYWTLTHKMARNFEGGHVNPKNFLRIDFRIMNPIMKMFPIKFSTT